jgi:hypothetical protein
VIRLVARTRSKPLTQEVEAHGPIPFQDRFKRGAKIRAAEFSFEALQHQVQEINARFGLSLRVTDEIYHDLQLGLRVVCGAVEDAPPIRRKDFERRVDRLQEALASATRVLGPAKLSSWEEQADSEFMFFLAGVVARCDNDVKEGLSLLQTYLRLLEALKGHCDRAGVILGAARAKTGRRNLEFYSMFMQLMVPMAQRLGMKVSTAGDRIEDPYATPFTVLIYALEGFLPKGARSNSLSACAKRIDRTLKELGVARQN